MTTTNVDVTDNMMDFSLSRRSIRFKIDDDVFEATPDIPALTVLGFVDQAEGLERGDLSSKEQLKIIEQLFRMMLFPESAERFITRMNDVEHPIGVKQFTDILRWLFEEYGLRPTEPDSVSSTGPDDPASGTSSTAPVSDAG